MALCVGKFVGGRVPAETIPNLAAHTDLSNMYTDSGHGGPTSDEALAKAGVQHIQTAIRGREPNPEMLSLTDFDICFNETGQPAKTTCPEAQTVTAQASQQGKSFVAHIDLAQCANCPFLAKCPAPPGKRNARHHLRFTLPQARSTEQRRISREKRKESGNLRSAVEATVRCVRLPYPATKLPVRGKFRVACMMIGSAAVTNIRRIQCYALQRCLQAKKAAEKLANQAQSGQNAILNATADLFCRHPLFPAALFGPRPCTALIFGLLICGFFQESLSKNAIKAGLVRRCPSLQALTEQEAPALPGGESGPFARLAQKMSKN